jgi:hypothetical protein
VTAPNIPAKEKGIIKMKKFNVYRCIRGYRPSLVESYDTFDAAFNYVRNKYPLVINDLEQINEGY